MYIKQMCKMKDVYNILTQLEMGVPFEPVPRG
jgi:hypothetical protein